MQEFQSCNILWKRVSQLRRKGKQLMTLEPVMLEVAQKTTVMIPVKTNAKVEQYTSMYVCMHV
jgi:hypothetical protein